MSLLSKRHELGLDCPRRSGESDSYCFWNGGLTRVWLAKVKRRYGLVKTVSVLRVCYPKRSNRLHVYPPNTHPTELPVMEYHRNL